MNYNYFFIKSKSKKILKFLLLFLILISFRHVPAALFLPKINGVKCYSLFIDAGESNGYSYYLYKYPLLTFVSDKQAKWRKCNKLHENVLGYIRSVTSWPEIVPYYVSSYSVENRYGAYIKSGNIIIFIEAFPDFGGIGPSEDEKKVCALP